MKNSNGRAKPWDRVVCNTGPVLGLQRIGQLVILEELISEIVLPSVVAGELRAGVGGGDMALQRWVQGATVCNPTAPIETFLIAEVDAGEAAVIALARELNLPVLMDEKKGRKVGMLAYNLTVFGTGRILVEAKRLGLIRSVRLVMGDMRAAGYFLSDRLVDFVAREAGE